MGADFVAVVTSFIAAHLFVAELALLYWPNMSYDELTPGATLSLREGPHIVGFGAVKNTPIIGAK